jgi:flagellar protein FliO/FliZ
MDALDALRAIAALALVLGVILGANWALRRFGGALRPRGAAPSDLRVVEWRTLDVRRKLVVVLWDGREHLVCLGPAGDTLIAQRPAPPDPAAPAASGDPR